MRYEKDSAISVMNPPAMQPKGALMIVLLLMFACKDQVEFDTSDSTVQVDSDSAVDSDSGVEITCTAPTFTPYGAWEWGQTVTLGGYSLASTNSRVWITAPVQGEYYAIDYGVESGTIFDHSQAKLTVEENGADKMSIFNDYFVAAAATTNNYAGTVHALPAADSDALVGQHELAGVATLSVDGETENGFVGNGMVYDLNLDGVLDFITSSGPVPSTLSFFDGASSGSYVYSDGVEIPGCDEDNKYGTTSYAIFGIHSTYLAIGCPGNRYATGEVNVFELPLDGSSTPVLTVEDVSGWYVDGFEGSPLVIDSRGNAAVHVLADSAEGFTEYITSNGSSNYYGAAPTIRQNEDGCFSLIFGEQGAEPVGALYHMLLLPDGSPTGEEPDSLLISPPEGVTLQWIGAVNTFSPDGAYLASSGWERAGVGGGGLVLYQVQ